MPYNGNKARFSNYYSYENSKNYKSSSQQNRNKFQNSNINKFNKNYVYENKNNNFPTKSTRSQFDKHHRENLENSKNKMTYLVDQDCEADKDGNNFLYSNNIGKFANSDTIKAESVTNNSVETIENVTPTQPLKNFSTKESIVNFVRNINSNKNKRSMNEDHNETVGKKPKISEPCFSDSPNFNAVIKPKLQDLQQHQNDIEIIKNQISSQKVKICKIKEEFRKEQRLLKEMKLKKKTLSKKMRNICHDIFHNLSISKDKDETDCVVVEQDLRNIIHIGSSSESENDSDSTSIEFVSESFPQVSTGSKKSLGTDETKTQKIVSEDDNTDHINLSDSNSTMELEIIEPILNVEIDAVLPTSSLEPPGPSDNSNLPVVISPEQELPVPIDTKIESTRLGFEMKGDDFYRNFNVDMKNFVVPNDNKTVEPKLSSFVLSDREKTFITDLKIFNNRLFVCGSHGILRQYEMNSHQCVMEYFGHHELVHCLLPTVSKTTEIRKLFSGGFDQRLLIHNIDTGALVKKIDTDRPILSLCENQLNYVYVGTGGGMIFACSIAKDEKMSGFQASDSGISCMAFTKDSDRNLLFVGSNNGEYLVYDAVTFGQIKIITPVAHNEAPLGFIILQKQRLLAYTRNYVHFINYTKIKSSTSLNHFSSINSMCLTRNYAIFGGVTGKISVYKMKGSQIHKTRIQSIDNGSSPVLSLTFYNNTIISGNKSGQMHFSRLTES